MPNFNSGTSRALRRERHLAADWYNERQRRASGRSLAYLAVQGAGLDGDHLGGAVVLEHGAGYLVAQVARVEPHQLALKHAYNKENIN